MSDQYAMPMGLFAKGWKLLLLQPWGWRYRGLVEDPQTKELVASAEASAQMEFYYGKLRWAQGDAWLDVAARFAEGDKWPSVHELRMALQHINGKYIKALPQPAPQLIPMPDEVRAQINRLVGKEL
jgi:hypothetical protein